MVSMASLVGFAFFLILAGMLANVGVTTRRKIETQSAADAVAQSAALARARALNAVTAANHLVGELTALVVLHHALGGDELDSGDTPDGDPAVKTELEVSFETADALCSGEFFSPSAGTKDAVLQLPAAGATLHDAVIRLQRVFAWDCQAYAVSGLLMKLKEVPIINLVAVPLGIAIGTAATIYDVKIHLEREILKGLEMLAKALLPVKRALESQGIRLVHLAGMAIAAEVPGRVPDVVEAVGRDNAVAVAGTSPARPVPPTRPEPSAVDPLWRSQIVRATYPWINHWRVPVIDFMKDWLVLSRARHYYKMYSNQFTETKCRLQKEQHSVHLLILTGFDPASKDKRKDKGEETWTTAKGSSEAERLFGVFAAVRHEPPRAISSGIYGQGNPDGLFAYAQALTYNANPQERGSGGSTQARIGWDTLNWGVPVPEFAADPQQAPDQPSDYPQVTLNWQAKLVPVTRGSFVRALPELALRHAELERGLRRTLPYSLLKEFLTH
jgi:hypothetical protein